MGFDEADGKTLPEAVDYITGCIVGEQVDKELFADIVNPWKDRNPDVVKLHRLWFANKHEGEWLFVAADIEEYAEPTCFAFKLMSYDDGPWGPLMPPRMFRLKHAKHPGCGADFKQENWRRRRDGKRWSKADTVEWFAERGIELAIPWIKVHRTGTIPDPDPELGTDVAANRDVLAGRKARLPVIALRIGVPASRNKDGHYDYVNTAVGHLDLYAIRMGPFEILDSINY